MHRTLKILFVILLLFSSVEFGYYVYILSIQKKAETPNKDKISSNDKPGGESAFINQDVVNTYLTDILPKLSKRKKNDYQNFYFVYDDSGIIKELQYTASPQHLFIRLMNDNDSNLRGYNLDELKIKSTIFETVKNGIQSSSSFKDFHEGDKIIIRWWESLVDKKFNKTEYILVK